jgi:hypothetical protein
VCVCVRARACKCVLALDMSPSKPDVPAGERVCVHKFIADSLSHTHTRSLTLLPSRGVLAAHNIARIPVRFSTLAFSVESEERSEPISASFFAMRSSARRSFSLSNSEGINPLSLWWDEGGKRVRFCQVLRSCCVRCGELRWECAKSNSTKA